MVPNFSFGTLNWKVGPITDPLKTEDEIIRNEPNRSIFQSTCCCLYLFLCLYPLKEGHVLFNDALNTFYLWLYEVGHMVKDHSDSKTGNPLLLHGLLLPISSKGSFICTIPDRIAHTSHGALAGTRNSSIDPMTLLHHEQMLLPRSYIWLPSAIYAVYQQLVNCLQLYCEQYLHVNSVSTSLKNEDITSEPMRVVFGNTVIQRINGRVSALNMMGRQIDPSWWPH